MNPLFNFALGVLLAVLQATVKNPKSVAAEKAILIQIRDLINQVLAGIPASAAPVAVEKPKVLKPVKVKK